MSFGGSTGAVPKKKPSNFAIEEQRTDTVEQARPLPWFCGVVRVGLTWLGQPFNVLAKPITYDTKKQEVIAGYDYYAGAAGLVGVGEVQSLEAVYFDEHLAFEGPIRNDGDPVEITIEGFGTMKIYWGSDDQTVDGSLAALATGVVVAPNPEENHPAYRGQCYVVFDQLYLGEGRTAFPNVEVVVTRWPQPSWMTAAANVQGDCNPVAVLWDVLTNPMFGYGLSESRLDTTELDETANTLANECLGISSFSNKEEDGAFIIARICEHINGYVATTSAGKLTLRLIRPESSSGIPHFYEAHLAEAPQFQVEGIQNTINEVRIKFSDRTRRYKESTAVATSYANRELTGEPLILSLDRPWFTRPYAANLTADITLQHESVPSINGTILLREGALSGLEPGGIFRLSYAHAGICNLVCRASQIDYPSPGDAPAVSVSFTSDKGVLSKGFSAPSVPTPNDPVIHEPEPLTNARLIEAPVAYMQFETSPIRPVIIPLAARSTGVTVGYKVHLQQPSGSYVEVSDVDQFTKYGTLQAAYGISPASIDRTVGMDILLQGPDNTLEYVSWDNNDDMLFAVIGNEILHCFEATLISAGRYRVYAFRAQAGTIQESHASGAGIHLINVRNIPTFQVSGELDLITVKFQPYVGKGRPIDLAEVTPIVLPITDLWARPPRPRDLTAIGDSLPGEGQYTAGDDIILAWSPGQIVNPSGYFESIENGGVEATAETCLEFWDVALGLRDTVTVAAGSATTTISNAAFQNIFLVGGAGSEPASCTIRAYHRKNGFKSQYYASATLTKV